jgi:hypothetical protein
MMVGFVCLPISAESQVFFTIRDLLTRHFQASGQVSFIRVRPAGDDRVSIERRLGRPLPQPEYVVYVARSEGHVDGFAIFDQELGQHEPIDFGTFFDADGRVARVEVMAYREPYGDGIRSARFRRQFVGRDAGSSFRPGRDIDIVSGATISSHSMSRAVRRAAVLIHETALGEANRLANR